MRRLREASPVWHAVAWIGIYVALLNVGDALSQPFGVGNAATAVLMWALAAVLVVYLKANGWLEHYGVRSLRRADLRRTLYYLPLTLIAVLQFAKGLNPDADARAVLLVVALMLAVGFVEEVIFRGLLYRALRTRRGVMAAVVISGVTFGVGHVANLARGYTGTQQLLQILAAVALGIVLALLFALTGTIMPGVVFHVLLNISGSVTADDPQLEVAVVAATVLLSAAYAAYLVRRPLESPMERTALRAMRRGGRGPHPRRTMRDEP